MKSFFLFLALSLGLFAQAQDALQQRINDMVQETFDPDGPGCAVRVERNGQLFYAGTAGLAQIENKVPMRTDHVFQIGSVTKQFTAVAILLLEEEGKLKVSDKITQHLDYPSVGDSITIEHLLTHTSGIPNYTSLDKFNSDHFRLDVPVDSVIAWTKDLPLEFAPGTSWNYSNSGYILLGAIIEKASGMSYADFVEQRLFPAAGMTQSYYGDQREVIPMRASGYTPEGDRYLRAEYLSMDWPYAAGSIFSTTEDLTRWTNALMAGRIIRPENVRRATTSYLLTDGTDAEYGYGLGITKLKGSPSIEHNGGIFGFVSQLIHLPEEKVTVCVLTNLEDGVGPDLAMRIALEMIGKSVTTAPVAIAAEELPQYEGVFVDDKGNKRYLFPRDGKLHSQRAGSRIFELVYAGNDRFYFTDALSEIAFVRNKKKKVIALDFTERSGKVTRWNKTDEALPIKKEVTVDAASLQRYAGNYELNPGFVLVVTVGEGHLVCTPTGQSPLPIYPAGGTSFFAKDIDVVIDFHEATDGSIDSLVLKQGGAVLPAVRK